ncbi:aldose epimerase family protein [Lentilactobacillus buchneri]|uniref:aldose epimerase family protein n=1 Tax=Lentilactobacillus buchneri TaxID=1581 RepID=UPI0012924F8D|nr:aldose epimerase family protein [Lentilactobacillus buchneri]MQN25246.1 galactose mutarotase [Lentilactobacillus buchneri]
MNTKKELFDKLDGQDIEKFTITNDHNVSVSAITFGATLEEFNVPGPDGKPTNILVSVPSSEELMKNQYFCQAIGRTAGRITNGTFKIKGQEYHVDSNEGTTTLHGGPHGFNTQIWDGSFDGDTIVFTKHIDSSEDSFPGNIDVKITFSLNNDNELTATYSAKSDADTLFNPTQHMYFNLSEGDSINGQSLQINADKYLELNKDKTPTGKKVAVDDTPYDFRDNQNLKVGIADMKAEVGHSYDEVFEINDHQDDKPVATLSDPESGRSISISSKRNALVVFTPDDLTGTNYLRGKGGPYMAIALEAQNLPDTPNHEDFGDVTLPAGEEKTYSIKYKVEF